MKITKRVAMLGLLSALSIVFVPITALIPLPGLKIGIANVITLFALCTLGGKDAFCVLLIRCLVSALLFGNPTGFAMSMSGGCLALLGMWTMLNFPRIFSRCGVSIAGAALHNTGQIICAAVWMKNLYVFCYLPLLLLASLLTGACIGALYSLAERYIPKNT